MVRHRALGQAGFFAAVCLGMACCNPPVAFGELHHGIIYYVAPPDDATRNKVADRYDFAVCGLELDAANVDYIKSRNPDFRWFVYNSGSDNYVSSGEDNFLAARAQAYGWDVEEAYMHYWEDTQVTIQGQSKFIPGWGGGSATAPSQARVPVYYADLSRRLIHCSTPHARRLQMEAFLHEGVDRTFKNSSTYPDGVFLDNSACVLWNYGEVSSGGAIREHPTHAAITSSAFQDWYWNQNYAPFLGALKDTLADGASWHPDGKRKYVMINNSNSWTETFTTYDVADVLMMEFQYSPVRNQGTGMVMTAFQRARTAYQGGIDSFMPSLVVTSVTGYQGSYTYGEGIRGNLAFYLAARAPSSSLFIIGTFNLTDPEWETKVWAGCMDVADQQLGEAVGDPYAYATGTDPRGYPYVVTGREYEHGLVLVRPRGNWNEHIDSQTAVAVSLPAAMLAVAPDGGLGAPVSSVTLRNGEGLFLLENPDTGSSTLPLVDHDAALRVLATSPPDDGVDASPRAHIRFLLSLPLDPATVNSSSVVVLGTGSGAVPGTVSVEGGLNMVVFHPSSPLQPGETVTAVLGAAVSAIGGASLDGNGDGLGGGTPEDDFEITFTVVNAN